MERISQSLAMLDAIMCPEWANRYFSFNAKWDISSGNRMASMCNGSGDEYFLLFSAEGAIMKGFDYESLMSPWSSESRAVWPGVLDHVPPQFSAFLNEPAFNLKDTSFCIWRAVGDSQWSCGPVSFPADDDDLDGSARWLWALDGKAETYHDFARDYFELEPELTAVAEIFAHRPLTAELIRRLNPQTAFADIESDVAEIGYPAS